MCLSEKKEIPENDRNCFESLIKMDNNKFVEESTRSKGQNEEEERKIGLPLFFLQERKIVPPLFFLEERKIGLPLIFLFLAFISSIVFTNILLSVLNTGKTRLQQILRI